jgi:hypothetical protein
MYLSRNIKKKPRDTEIGSFKYSDSDMQTEARTSKLIEYWTSVGFKDYSKKFRKPALQLKLNTFSSDPYDYIINDYRFKKIEFGNWVTNEDRFNYLYQFIIAIHDLNVVLKFDENIGLWHSQSIAFGAHGAGRALAHYEWWTGFINLTRYKREGGSKEQRFLHTGGIGSFAHEYGHALDFFFGAFVEKKKGSFTLTTASSEDVRTTNTHFKKEDLQGSSLRAQMNLIMINVIWKKYDFAHPQRSEHTEYYKKLKMTFAPVKDGKAKKNEYWFRRIEIWARLFEQYIQHKLKSKGIQNSFLAKLKYEDSRYLPEKEFKTVVADIDYLMKKLSAVAKRSYAIKE